MSFDFFIQAVGIVFRESLEAVLIYGIIVSFFLRARQSGPELRAARLGLTLGISAAVLLGIGISGAAPLISDEIFSKIEIAVIFAGSLLMLYMVFWMQRHARTMKNELEASLIRAASLGSVLGTVFVAVFREGVEAVVYLYSLSLQNSAVAHTSSLLLSLAVGVTLSVLVYRLILRGSRFLSMQLVFRITGFWLLFSSSALFATGIDKLFAAGFFERWSEAVYDLSIPENLAALRSSIESLAGFRFQPSPIHLVTFSIFWIFVIATDPLRLWRKQSLNSRGATSSQKA